jgi:hypothetical protein
MVACATEVTARPGAEIFDRPQLRKLSGLAGRTSLFASFPIEYLQYVIRLCTNQSLNLTQSSDSFAVFALVIPFPQGEQIPTQRETLSEKYCRRQSNG